jgi:hypothetical protein
MSFLSGDATARGTLDYVLMAVAGSVVLAFVGIGLYGTFTGFLQTIAYFKANDIVSFCCALISAGCGWFLMLELFPGHRGRTALGVVVICGMFGYFAVSKGVPAAVTLAYGKPGSVMFDVVSFDWGGKGCSSTVVARHRDYEDFRQCIKYFTGPRPEIGMHIEVRGVISNWGIVRENYRVLR